MVEKLAAYTFSFEEAPEYRYPLEMDIEALTDWTLDAIQFSYCKLALLNSDFLYISLSKEDLDGLLTPYRELKDSIKPDLKNFHYKFSDLTSPNEISKVLNWWKLNLDPDFRRQKKLLGKIGLTSAESRASRDNKDIQYNLSLSFPDFLAPEVILYKQSNYDIYNSNEAKVSINGQQLANSIVLSIQVDQEAENINIIMREFLKTFFYEQNKFIMDIIDFGTGPRSIFKVHKESVSSFLQASSSNYHLIKKYQSVSKYLSGLMLYDAHVKKKEAQQQPSKPKLKKSRRESLKDDKNNNLDEVAKEVLDTYSQIKLTIESLVSNYDDVRKQIMTINETLIKTFPTYKSRFKN